MLTSLQALLRLATLRWLGVFVCALATLLATTSSASALEPAQTKTRVWGFDFAADNSVGLFRAASSGKHQRNRLARAEAASGSLLAAREGLRPMVRSLGAGGDDILLKKAVNSNLPHAAARGVERGVFGSADEAATALRSLTDQINKVGTFPSGTLVDTANKGRFLVPTGNNGLAVYQLANNGTAKLKTVLIAR